MVLIVEWSIATAKIIVDRDKWENDEYCKNKNIDCTKTELNVAMMFWMVLCQKHWS